MAEQFTPLPADLPENWTPGQIVSPSGTDVGLTKQHGYNYVGKAINDTQRAVNGLAEQMVGAGVPVVVTQGTGSAYTATVPGVTELKAGMLLVIIPHVDSETVDATLNVNGLGAVKIRRPNSDMSYGQQLFTVPGFLWSGEAVLLKKSNTNLNDPLGCWIAVEHAKTAANDLTGVLPTAQLPIVPESKGGTGRSSLVGTDYSTYRVRSAAIVFSVPTSMSNGTLAFVYL